MYTIYYNHIKYTYKTGSLGNKNKYLLSTRTYIQKLTLRLYIINIVDTIN